MLTSKKWLVLSVVLILITGLIFLGVRNRTTREYKLSDGSVLRIEQVSFGKKKEFIIGGWQEKLKAFAQHWLPKAWSKKMIKPASSIAGRTSWYMNSTTHTNNDALWIWLTRRDASGNYISVDFNQGELIDSHGCALIATQIGGSDDGRLAPSTGFHRGGRSSVTWLLFEAFPRHEKSFLLKVFENQSSKLAQFTIANTAYSPPHDDHPSPPPPVSVTTNHVTFSLSSMKYKTNNPASHVIPRLLVPYEINPDFKVLENGALSTNWQALDFELHDGSGNFASDVNPHSHFLCPWEQAWKLHVNFFGSESATMASNVTWSIKGIKVPGSGEFVELDSTRTLPGIRIEALALAGAGTVTYSNEVPVKAEKKVPDSDSTYPTMSEKSGNNGNTGERYTMRTMQFKMPSVAISITGLTNTARLTICATDEKGRRVYAQDWTGFYYGPDNSGSDEVHYLENHYHYYQQGPSFFKLKLPEDTKTVDLTFCIHYPVPVEFVFKPPGLVK